jgi:hypothetical protein
MLCSPRNGLLQAIGEEADEGGLIQLAVRHLLEGGLEFAAGEGARCSLNGLEAVGAAHEGIEEVAEGVAHRGGLQELPGQVEPEGAGADAGGFVGSGEPGGGDRGRVSRWWGAGGGSSLWGVEGGGESSRRKGGSGECSRGRATGEGGGRRCAGTAGTSTPNPTDAGEVALRPHHRVYRRSRRRWRRPA